MFHTHITKSERAILVGLDNLPTKTARKEVLRRWANLTPRGISLVLERMQNKLLIARSNAGEFQITFGGMKALA